jgi:hypothetical protein
MFSYISFKSSHINSNDFEAFELFCSFESKTNDLIYSSRQYKAIVIYMFSNDNSLEKVLFFRVLYQMFLKKRLFFVLMNHSLLLKLLKCCFFYFFVSKFNLPVFKPAPFT